MEKGDKKWICFEGMVYKLVLVVMKLENRGEDRAGVEVVSMGSDKLVTVWCCVSHQS